MKTLNKALLLGAFVSINATTAFAGDVVKLDGKGLAVNAAPVIVC